MQRRLLKGVLAGLGAVLIATIVFIGPWPAATQPYHDGDYASATLQRLEAAAPDLRPGPLYAGAATVDMTPPPGVPLAGYAARDPKANTGVRDRIYAKALTLSNGINDVTLLSGDYLLALPELLQAVLHKSGLKRDQLYLMASHTHSGPGAYAHGLVAHFALGDFDRSQFERMAAAMADAVRASRATLRPATIAVHRLMPSRNGTPLVINQLTDRPGYAPLWVLQVHERGGVIPMATLISYSAHATVLGRINTELSGDYPAPLQRTIEERLGGVVIFAAGAVGGMLPTATAHDGTLLEAQLQQMHDLANDLAAAVVGAGGPPLTSFAEAPLAHTVLSVDLPTPNYHAFEGARLSPFLIHAAFHDGDTTFVDALRLGNLILLGYPADFSGELAASLEQTAMQHGLLAWVTSFNGDYIGYVMPHARHSTPHYTTRSANIYGPWAGDYLTDLGRRLLRTLGG